MAKRNISPGEEVTDCYGIHHLSMGLADRREALQRGYAFACGCRGCADDLPLLPELNATVPPQVAAKLGATLSK